MQPFITNFCCLLLAYCNCFAFQRYHDSLILAWVKSNKYKLIAGICIVRWDGEELLNISLHSPYFCQCVVSLSSFFPVVSLLEKGWGGMGEDLVCSAFS